MYKKESSIQNLSTPNPEGLKFLNASLRSLSCKLCIKHSCATLNIFILLTVTCHSTIHTNALLHFNSTMVMGTNQSVNYMYTAILLLSIQTTGRCDWKTYFHSWSHA